MNKNITMLIISFLIVAVIGVMQQSTSYEQSNFGDTVVFYPQHEDDETLWAGSAILEAIKERGADNVYVVLVSYGTGIKEQAKYAKNIVIMGAGLVGMDALAGLVEIDSIGNLFLLRLLYF